ncbi:C-3 sterol dehydrogenase/C-4 decarboxylase family protein [Metarhizium album ARSEF 1941]|uniref:Sterol-4-alpha-carboxylate 3-dehydrogenase ERG26, decarboxylating n=1 Tax=Metarhizium album (strain ARSEF 1941) TaxID=1081103 RepID=A0A0B2WLB5_METAS|nr:C-3 sterol dehydrogenase/C-4 decarboxylase family protein [Metarhizium album ARSEF 1941]KHN94489.1 C-3 sterol dehydrogenase/C-4 decarboxylase family protein [Metarhizium album ARSEF 1941]
MPERGHLGHLVVIGGNGFLGHHIINLALSQWTTQSVSSIDLRCQHNRNAAASYHECDITDTERLSSLLQHLKPDVVIHTASPTASGDTKTAKELFKKVNVHGTQSVIDACRAASVKALVYTSSASVISDNQNDLRNADERWPVIRGPQQHEYYSETKAAAEQLVLAANRSPPSELLTTALRPAGIFGEGDVQTLPGFIKAYKNNKSHIQLGDNTNIFDFTYVGNVAHAHLLAAHALLATASAATRPLDHEKVDGEVFLITNDSPCYFWDFARAVWRAAGSDAGTGAVWTLGKGTSLTLGVLSELFFTIIGKPPTFTKTRATMATMTRYYNITKAKSVLRYEPLWTLQEGVTRGVAWFLEQDKKKA